MISHVAPHPPIWMYLVCKVFNKNRNLQRALRDRLSEFSLDLDSWWEKEGLKVREVDSLGNSSNFCRHWSESTMSPNQRNTAYARLCHSKSLLPTRMVCFILKGYIFLWQGFSKKAFWYKHIIWRSWQLTISFSFYPTPTWISTKSKSHFIYE